MSRKKVWMPQMDDIIRQNSDKTDSELVMLLGGIVTENAVRKRRQSLGIRHKRGRRTTVKEIPAYAVTEISDEAKSQISDMVNSSVDEFDGNK